MNNNFSRIKKESVGDVEKAFYNILPAYYETRRSLLLTISIALVGLILATQKDGLIKTIRGDTRPSQMMPTLLWSNKEDHSLNTMYGYKHIASFFKEIIATLKKNKKLKSF